MSEKGDMPGDTVSLPPTYAPSEAYTESPPPAYRGSKSSRVQIVKMVCVTVVVSAFIIGFFIITSNYLNARACNCSQDGVELSHLKAAGFFEPPKASSLVGLENNKIEEEVMKGEGKQLLGVEDEAARSQQVEDEGGMNDLDLGDDTTLPKIEVIKELPINPEEVEALVEEAEREVEEELIREEEEEEALKDILNAQMDHMKKIKLPVDLILGNPALAGRNVNCEVERRQQPIGPGIMTQAIIVTCHDPEDPPRPSPMARPFPMGRQSGPPLSILAPIMKMLASRPVPNRPAPCSPQRPCYPPPQMLVEGRNLMPMNIRGPIPILAPQNRFSSLPRMAPQHRIAKISEDDGPRNKMLPIQLQPMVKMSPRMPRLLASSQPFSAPISLASLHRGALPMPMPQPRAAKDPISLPGLRLRPTPFLPQDINVPIMRGARRDDRPVTHMEMQAPPKFNGPNHHQEPKKDFGPPRVHTVITPAQPRHFNGPPQSSNQVPLFRDPMNSNQAPHFRGPMNSNQPPPFRGPMNSNQPPQFRGPMNSNQPPQFRGPMNSNQPPQFRGPMNSSQPPQFLGPINSNKVPQFRGSINSNQPPQFRGPINPAHLPHNIRIQTNPLPKDIHILNKDIPISPLPKEIMMPPKPIAHMSHGPSVLPIAGPPAVPPPPRFDPNGRRGPVREINVDAEMLVQDTPHQPQRPSPPQPQPSPSQQPPSPPPSSIPDQSSPRKHHLLMVN